MIPFFSFAAAAPPDGAGCCRGGVEYSPHKSVAVAVLGDSSTTIVAKREREGTIWLFANQGVVERERDRDRERELSSSCKPHEIRGLARRVVAVLPNLCRTRPSRAELNATTTTATHLLF